MLDTDFHERRDVVKTGGWRVAIVSLIVASLVSSVSAQGSFRVTYKVTRTTATHTEVEGVVYNDARADATDVSVTVEAVGASGKAVARGITFVSSQIREGSSAGFTAKIPLVPGTTGFRASVTAFKFTQSLQGP